MALKRLFVQALREFPLAFLDLDENARETIFCIIFLAVLIGENIRDNIAALFSAPHDAQA